MKDSTYRRPKRAITHFGKNMRTIRKAKGMNLKELEDEVLGYHALSDIENGYREPQPEERRAIAEKLGIPAESLEKWDHIGVYNNFINQADGHYSNQVNTSEPLNDAHQLFIENLVKDKEHYRSRCENYQQRYEEAVREIAALKAEIALLQKSTGGAVQH